MSKEQATQAIKASDLKDDWIYPIISQIEDRYAAGYLARRIEEISNYLSWEQEGFRELILEAMDYNIWEK